MSKKISLVAVWSFCLSLLVGVPATMAHAEALYLLAQAVGSGATLVFLIAAPCWLASSQVQKSKARKSALGTKVPATRI